MTCKICNSIVIYIDDAIHCPKCEELKVVPYEDSLKIMNHYINTFQSMFFSEVKKYHKTHILTNIFWQREKQIRKFYAKYSTIDLARLAACNLLLRRVIKKNDFLNQEIVSEEIIEKFIETYSELTRFEEDEIRLEAKNWTMLALVKYDLDNLASLPLKDSIIICPNESYDRIMKTFSKYNVMSEETANEKMKIWEPQYVAPILGSDRSMTSKDTIERFYELISDFYVAFFRSRIYYEAFDLSKVEKITIDPLELKKIATQYVLRDNIQSATKYSDFQANLISKLGGRFREFLTHFVLSENNPNANPVFLRVTSPEAGDLVLISQAFTELFSYPLHAILNRDIFDKEVENRSKKFESEIVKKEFEGKGYRYFANHKVKNKMEIDGIAISTSEVYVIEVKGWKSSKLLEEKLAKEKSEKEIRYAIEGIHYDYDSGKLKKKVSLPEKISWVSNNRKRFGILPSTQIKGMLVINEDPVMTEYAGCQVKFMNDFTFN